MPYAFKLTTRLPATPQQVYDAWMSSEGHTAMTGGIAHLDPRVGGSFDAWDDYISGTTTRLEPASLIVQNWRTAHFDPQHEDSIIKVELVQEGDMTVLVLTHGNVPDGQTSYEEVGWKQFYFEPMQRRFQWLRMQSQI